MCIPHFFSLPNGVRRRPGYKIWRLFINGRLVLNYRNITEYITEYIKYYTTMKAFGDDLHWRVIYHQFLLGSSAELTANVLFVSKRFVQKIRAIYRRNGNVSRARRRGKQRFLSGELTRQL